MSDGRTGEFKLKRQKAGVGYFGQVRVRLAAGAAPVSWQGDPADTSSLQPGVADDDEFIAAALAGAADGLRLLAEAGVDVAGQTAQVVHVQLNYTDIEVSAVRAAAALAVAEAFGVPDRLELGFDDGWTVTLAG
ncbi:hypothetical protein BBK82_00175 [Lentzea guizhouensis]|uniref:Uncharacterized protein n=1 Tax=Lentzea guizhouensis TaxID=1586287 RepID=A0A1B2HAJ5_9PSEU|nr:hypothetical protein [Lentzea guizhouensis]ANZ34728.1 hypothetical protein BBK82_00175 [Lentzea guizhouensis]